MWIESLNGDEVDVFVLGSLSPKLLNWKKKNWKRENEDGMYLEYRKYLVGKRRVDNIECEFIFLFLNASFFFLFACCTFYINISLAMSQQKKNATKYLWKWKRDEIK